ncbi:uncharacterized protein KIAA0825 homolog [Tachypleus tridentatus]|uniref:uncharacterized protein KIAA0825 homolog n=1 Tax=Tachypleus tridentatus TaxID=6853 RepID=UPI003FD65618
MVCIGYFQPLVVTWTEVQKNYTEFIADHVSSVLRVLDGLRQEQKTWPDIVKLIFCLKEKNQCFMNHSQEQQCDSAISEEYLETLIFEEKGVFVDIVEQDRLSVEVHPGSGKSRSDRWNGKSFKSTKSKGSLVSKGSLSVIMNDTYLDTRKSSLTVESGKNWTTKFNENKEKGHMAICQLTDIILNMVEAFLKFEEQINSLHTGGPVCDDSNFAAQSICFQLLGGVNSSFPDESPKQSPFHQTKTASYGSENCASLSWDWRSCLVESGYLNMLQRTLQHSIQEIIQEEIHLEWERFNRGEELPKREVYMNTSEGIKDRKAVLRSVLNFVKELHKYIPAVEAAQGVFVPFCASFVHTVHSYTSDILHHMEQISLWVPHETSVTTLYVLLNTAVYLEFNLKTWSNILGEGNNNRFHFSVEAVLNKTAGLVTALDDRIVHYHMKLLRCGILQDVDSHNWRDLKPFFEGERVSFTVQMWNFYMRGLVYDLWKFLTASRSQVILGTILVETLKQFSIQYVNALPSDVRTAQMKADITAILLSVSYILSSVCSKDSEMFGRVSCFENSHTPQYVTLIHSHCSRLLLILAVVTSPLHSLYKVFKKGFPIQTSSEQFKKPVINPWLTWLCPTLFSNDCQSPLMSSISVWLYVKLCVSQPVPSADLICKVFSLHDCTLSTLLVIQSAHCSEKEKTKLVQTIFLVLRCCDHAPDGLGGVFWSVIQRYKGWMEFDKSRFTAQLSERPWWYHAFQKILFPFYKRMLRCVLPEKLITLSSNRSSQHSAWLDLKQDLLDTFTCTCQPHLAETPPDNINILSIACLSILSNVIDLIPFLPQPFLVCMTLLDLWLPGCEIQPIPLYGCAGLQVLVSGLCGVLKDPEFLHEVFETDVDASAQKLCTQLAETLEKLVAPTFITSEIHIPQDYTDKAREQLMCMKKLFEPKSESQKDTNEDSEEYCYQEVEEMRIHFMTSQLLQDPKGPEAVNYLFDLLQSNLKWIRKSLGISSILSTNDVLSRITPSPHSCSERNSTDKSTKSSFTKSKEVSQNTQSSAADAKSARKKKSSESESVVEGSSGTRRSSWEDFKLEHLNTMLSHISEEEKEDVKYDLILSREGKTDETFNPMEEYQLIGDSYFDQKALADFPFRWEDLLHQTPQLGLTNISFTNLLSHRWDIRGVTSVPSSQEKYIQVLKTTYHINNVQSNQNVI